MKIINLVSTKEYADFIIGAQQTDICIHNRSYQKGTTLILQVEIIVAYKLLTSHNNVQNTGYMILLSNVLSTKLLLG